MKSSLKILLCHLNSNGDCLLATTIARQIKKDYPNATLTWAIGKCCSRILTGNPYVDEIVEFPLEKIDKENVISNWNALQDYAAEQQRKGVYDLVFYTQYSYGYFKNYMGITRASIFGGYPNKLTVPLNPILELTKQELENVKLFAEQKGLKRFSKVILFECAAYSGQSFVNREFVNEFCRLAYAQCPDYGIILSANVKFEIDFPNIINANELSFRENAALANHCDLLLGCSSGITWLSISNSVKHIPIIILLNEDYPQASMILDHKYFGLPYDHIFEAKKCAPQKVLDLIKSMAFKSPLFNEIKLVLPYEKILFYTPFNIHFANKDWKKIRLLFKRADIRIKFFLLLRLLKALVIK